MNRLRMTAIMALWSGLAVAGGLDDLVREVQESQARERQADAERTARFMADKNQQQKLLNDTKAALAKAEAENKALREQFAANEARLKELGAQIKTQSGDLGNLYGTVREFSGMLRADLENSLVSAQYPGRADALDGLAAGKDLPGTDQLELLWSTLLQEMAETGRTVKFRGRYTDAAGDSKAAEIVRVGPFTAFADGKFLKFDPGTARLSEMPRQPEHEYRSMAEDLGEGDESIVKVAVDPTRGAVLDTYEKASRALAWLPKSLRGLLANEVDVGIFGILLVASIWAVAVAFERWLFFRRVNPHRYESRGALEIDLTRNLNVIGTVAANAPFVGLLGTVLGIMLTFHKMGTEKASLDVHHIMLGLSTALKATAIGLMVAIPCVVLNNVLRRRIRELLTAYEVRHGS